MRRSLAIAILLSASTAHARPQGTFTVGVGGAAVEEAGWMVRIESTSIAQQGHQDDSAIAGAKGGVQFWSAGHRRGFDLPLSWYFGARIGDVRTSLGGGLSLLSWASLDRMGETDNEFGAAPFLDAALGIWLDDRAVVSLDARLSRHMFEDADHFTMYSVTMMVGMTTKK